MCRFPQPRDPTQFSHPFPSAALLSIIFLYYVGYDCVEQKDIEKKSKMEGKRRRGREKGKGREREKEIEREMKIGRERERQSV